MLARFRRPHVAYCGTESPPVVMRLYELTVGLVMALISRACARIPAM